MGLYIRIEGKNLEWRSPRKGKETMRCRADIRQTKASIRKTSPTINQ